MLDKSPGLKIVQIYLESAAFEHRADALGSPAGRAPDVGEIGVEMQVGLGRDDPAKALLRIAVSTKPEAKPMYQFRIVAVLLVHSDVALGAPPPDAFLRRSGLMLLYPFLRETVANLTMRGRFGPVWLNPIDPFGLDVNQLPPKLAKKRHRRALLSTRSKKRV